MTRALVVANRQIYQEALPVLYGERVFVFREVECVRGWLNLRSARARECVRHIYMVLDIDITGFAKSLARPRPPYPPAPSPLRLFSGTCRFLAEALTLKTLVIAFAGPAGMVCSNFQQLRWTRSLYRITGLEKLRVTTEKENVGIDQESVTFMRAKMEIGGQGRANARGVEQ